MKSDAAGAYSDYGDFWEDEACGYGRRYEEEDVVYFGKRYEAGDAQRFKNQYVTSASTGKNRKPVDDLDEYQKELYALLKAKRREIAQEENVPPYIVFTDRTLLDMCLKAPQTKEEMLKVSGVGENKFGKYASSRSPKMM